MPDHIHRCLSIPPTYSASHRIGYRKGKSAVRSHRALLNQRRMTGLNFWAKGYCVSTVGLDAEEVRREIQDQEKRDSGQPAFDFDAEELDETDEADDS